MWANPQNAICPDGYAYAENSIYIENTDCDGNEGFGCLKTLAELKEFCEVKDCVVITETTDTDAALSIAKSVMVTVGSSSATRTDADFQSCVKGKASIII